jgi:sec-independent protein translocase protein TatB
MFDIGWGELVVIGIVALIAIGPKELPTVLRSLGQWMGKIKRMASEFQGQFQEALREAEMADLKKHADDLTSAVTDATRYDPLEDLNKSMETDYDKPHAAGGDVAEVEPSASSAEPAAEPAQAVPAIDVAPPEPPPPVAEKDFTPVEPPPPKQAGGKA